ncbi:MAG: hypothetical protein DME25_04005 [Verrucomicrobia bacterium]|nr:MAG: hypothetical protein DME25_04005 [Verrucomicrobiota bacterium]
MKVGKTVQLPGAQVEISLGQDRDGRLVGLTAKGVYVMEPESCELVYTAAAPAHVGCGFALVDDSVYFGSGPTLWRCRLPGRGKQGGR